MTLLMDWYRKFIYLTEQTSGVPLLLLRLYLAPIFWIAGTNKLANFDNTVLWFEHSLNMPLPWLMAFLATWTEIIGAVLLVLGLAVRFISVPLMITMLVAAFSVHWDNGWQAIADPSSFGANEHAEEATRRLRGFMGWLENNFPGRHNYITELGKPVVLNNGIEFAMTYFFMLFPLFAFGAGRFTSVDDGIRRICQKKCGH